MTASGMHEAFKERQQVKGASVAVCELDRGGEEVKVSISNVSAFHNFSYEQALLLVDLFHGQSLSCKSKGLCS